MFCDDKLECAYLGHVHHICCCGVPILLQPLNLQPCSIGEDSILAEIFCAGCRATVRWSRKAPGSFDEQSQTERTPAAALRPPEAVPAWNSMPVQLPVYPYSGITHQLLFCLHACNRAYHKSLSCSQHTGTSCAQKRCDAIPGTSMLRARMDKFLMGVMTL